MRDRMGLTIYGIRNCDTMKKARSSLDAGGRLLVGFTPEVDEKALHAGTGK